MDKFPESFLGNTLAEKEIYCYGGFENDISFKELDSMKHDLCKDINIDGEYTVVLSSNPSGYDGGFELFMKVKEIITPKLSNSQIDMINTFLSCEKNTVINRDNLKTNTSNALYRLGILILEDDGFRLNSHIKYIL